MTGRPGIVAGIGFRHAAGADAILALIAQALAEAGRPGEPIVALATAADRADEAALREAARRLGLEPSGIGAEALRAVDPRVPTRSARLEAERGIGSLAEAAALAEAGEGGRLLLARIASGDVTCALALRGETP